MRSKVDGILRPRSTNGGIAADSAAQVSFSVVAVVLLLSTVAAGTYMAKREVDSMAEDRRDERLLAMEAAIAETTMELTLCAADRAQRIVSGWDSFPVNHSEVSDEFSESMSRYIDTGFPRASDGFDIAVGNWSGGLYFVEMRTMDIVPSDGTTESTLEVDGESMAYDDLAPPSDDLLSETATNPYYFAVGNFTVDVECDSVELHEECGFERPVISALPFIESKLRTFESAAVGEISDLGKQVGYMLTTLAQLRVLQGYGMPLYSNGLSTEDIITEEDVYRAVLVGLLLEQARLFRAVDEGFAYDVADECGGDDIGVKAVLGSAGRYIDPAELFLWFIGTTEIRLDPRLVVAQAVDGLADQLVVKFMDYMGWLGMLDLADQALDTVSDSIDSLVCYLTGEDKAHRAVVSWIEDVLRAVGAEQRLYSQLFSNTCDCWVLVPERQYYVTNASGGLIPVWLGGSLMEVDIPTYDLLASPVWSGFYDVYKEHQQTVRSLATDGIQRLAYDIATQTVYDLESVWADPTDDTDVFTAMASVSGDAALSIDRDALAESVKRLPMFSSQHAMSSDLAEFALGRCDDLFDDGLADGAASDLAAALLDGARYPYDPDMVVPVEQQLREIVLNDVSEDVEWGVGEALDAAVRIESLTRLKAMLYTVDSSVVVADDGFFGPLVDSIAAALAVGFEGFPGLAEAVWDQIGRYSKAVLAQRGFAAHKTKVFVDLESPFEFWEGDPSSSAGEDAIREYTSVEVVEGTGPLETVPYDPGLGYEDLGSLVPVDSMLVQVRRPHDFDRSESDYPNTHLTSLLNASAVPYTTQWTVSARGQVTLRVSSNGSLLSTVLAGSPTSSDRAVVVDLCIPVVVHSAAPLDGVEYNPTNTLLSDGLAAARKFCDLVWEKLEPVVRWVRDGFDRVLWFLQDLFDVVSGFATRFVKALSTGMQVLVETLQEYLSRFAESVLGKAVKLMIDLTGTVELQISLYGFTIILQTNVPDLLFKEAKDLLRLMVHTRRLGPGITFGVRVARLSDGKYDFVINGTLATDDFTAEVVVDPLMLVKRRLVELHLVAKDWKLDLTIPEVEPYDLAEVSTGSLPGVASFLSRIPIPVLGLSAAIEMGMRVKYSPPFPTDVVVNEFEANPQGDDDGSEWVELYNPLDRAVDLSGWRLETSHGGVHTLELNGVVAPGGRTVFTFPETAIDNGKPGDPFNDGDAVMLLDPQGAVVDLTPTLCDPANDGRTHQRRWDGGPKWDLKPGTRGDSNGVPLFMATSDYIAKALFEAVREAFEETKVDEVTASLEFLKLLGRRVLDNFIDNLLDIVKEVVHEVVFYIEVTVNDAAGVAGAGFRLSFVVKGEAIAEILKWLVKGLATYLVNLGRASNPVEYPQSPSGFFANLFVRFEVLFTVGMPRMLTALGGRVDLDMRVDAVVAVAPNLPALGKLAGRDWGPWAVELGACLEGVPREVVGNTLVQSSGEFVDIWLVRAKAAGI